MLGVVGEGATALHLPQEAVQEDLSGGRREEEACSDAGAVPARLSRDGAPHHHQRVGDTVDRKWGCSSSASSPWVAAAGVPRRFPVDRHSPGDRSLEEVVDIAVARPHHPAIDPDENRPTKVAEKAAAFPSSRSHSQWLLMTGSLRRGKLRRMRTPSWDPCRLTIVRAFRKALIPPVPSAGSMMPTVEEV